MHWIEQLKFFWRYSASQSLHFSFFHFKKLVELVWSIVEWLKMSLNLDIKLWNFKFNNIWWVDFSLTMDILFFIDLLWDIFDWCLDFINAVVLDTNWSLTTVALAAFSFLKNLIIWSLDSCLDFSFFNSFARRICHMVISFYFLHINLVLELRPMIWGGNLLEFRNEHMTSVQESYKRTI